MHPLKEEDDDDFLGKILGEIRVENFKKNLQAPMTPAQMVEYLQKDQQFADAVHTIAMQRPFDVHWIVSSHPN